MKHNVTIHLVNGETITLLDVAEAEVIPDEGVLTVWQIDVARYTFPLASILYTVASRD